MFTFISYLYILFILTLGLIILIYPIEFFYRKASMDMKELSNIKSKASTIRITVVIFLLILLMYLIYYFH